MSLVDRYADGSIGAFVVPVIDRVLSYDAKKGVVIAIAAVIITILYNSNSVYNWCIRSCGSLGKAAFDGDITVVTKLVAAGAEWAVSFDMVQQPSRSRSILSSRGR